MLNRRENGVGRWVSQGLLYVLCECTSSLRIKFGYLAIITYNPCYFTPLLIEIKPGEWTNVGSEYLIFMDNPWIYSYITLR